MIGELWVCGTPGRKTRGLAISLLVSLASEEMFDGAFGLDTILEKTIGNSYCGLLEGLIYTSCNILYACGETTP